MKSTKLFYLLGLIFAFGLTFTSCKKDLPGDLEEDKIDNHSQQISAYNQGRTVNTDSSECFTFVYPINLVYPDGSVQTATDDESLFLLFSTDPTPWDFEYPFEVLDPEGNQIMIDGFEDLNDLIILCLGDDYDDYWEECPVFDEGFACYELVFPVSLEFEDGTVQTANNEDEFWDLLTSDVPPVDFAYPLSLIDEDGEELTANDADELALLLDECDDYYDPPFFDFLLPLTDCYEIEFPIEVVLLNGDVEVVEDLDAYYDLLDSDTPPVEVIYPISITDDEGEVTILENEEDLWGALEDCEFGGIDWPTDSVIFIFGCYDIEYPFAIVLEDGSIEEVTSEADFLDLLMSGDAFIDFVYPLTLIDEDGEGIEVNDEEDLFNAFEDCDDFGGIDPGDFDLVLGLILTSDPNNPDACYEIVYPISFETEDGIVTAADYDDLMNILNGADWPESPVYPFEVIDNETGNVLTIENADDLEDLLEDCDCV